MQTNVELAGQNDYQPPYPPPNYYVAPPPPPVQVVVKFPKIVLRAAWMFVVTMYFVWFVAFVYLVLGIIFPLLAMLAKTLR